MSGRTSGGSVNDAEREAMIRDLRRKMVEAYYAGEHEKARRFEREWSDLVRARSPQRVREMEREAGLA